MSEQKPFIPHADSIQTAWVLMCQQSRVSTQPPVEELEAEFDRFIAQVRTDAAREALDGLANYARKRQGNAFTDRGFDDWGMVGVAAFDYMDANYPETGDNDV